MCLGWWLAVLFCGLLHRSWLTEAWRNNHTCHSCAEARDQFAKIRLEQIKREILEKLGLDGPPQVRPSEGFPSIPQVAKYLRSQVRRDIHSSFLADESAYGRVEQKTEQTIIIAERAPARYNQNWLVGHFRFSNEIMSKSLRRAFLYVFLRKPSNFHFESRISTVQVIVREVLKDGKYGADVAERKRHVDLGREAYVQIPLRIDDLQRWWDDEGPRNEFLGLYVEALYRGENLAVHPQQNPTNLMYMELTSIDEWTRRKRSSTEMCTREMNEPSCCLYSLVVDFEAAGWDFVIAPKLYDAHMCSGECRLHHPDRSPHSKITSSTSKNMVSGCCHPSEYDPITLVYMTEEKEVKIKEVPGMIARRCACA
uniref:TGF-beta family profile domain-containing protein n=2 Tax=Parascaris univalens TaxID=6257 RepID=A0A914ZV16_PARUN